MCLPIDTAMEECVKTEYSQFLPPFTLRISYTLNCLRVFSAIDFSLVVLCKVQTSYYLQCLIQKGALGLLSFNAASEFLF